MFGSMERLRASDEGMTLLELIIAALILLFSLSALFGLLLTSTKMSVQSKEQNIATAAANSYLEQVRSLPYTTIGVVGGAGGSIEGTLPATVVTTNGSFTVTITPSVQWIDDPAINPGTEDYKEVRVVIEVGAPTRTPITRSFGTFVRAPGEIAAITGGGGASAGDPPIVEWVEGSTPVAGSDVRGGDVMVTVHVRTPNANGTIKRVQMFCGNPVLMGTGGGIPSNSYTTGEWIDLAVADGTYTFHWNTLATQEATTTRWWQDGQQKLYVMVYDNQSRTGTIERWVNVDNDPPGPLSSPPVPMRGSGQDITVTWGAAKNGAGASDWANIYEFFPFRDTFGAGGGGTGVPVGWVGVTHWEVTPATLSAPSHTWPDAQAFSRYWFQIRAENIVNNHGPLANQTAVPVVTRPKVKGTFANSSPSNNKVVTTVSMTVSPPTFTTTAISYQMQQSADGTTWTNVGTASSSPAVTWTSGSLNQAQFKAYYYKVVATFTPGGTRNAVSQTVDTKALGPASSAPVVATTTLAGSDTF